MGEAEAVSRKAAGQQAESRAVAFLEARGYQVVARNFSCPWGELDIVAEQGDTLCFVEVRMRASTTWGDPANTVSFAKQRRVVKAALHYLMRKGYRRRMIRFDVIAIVGRHADAELLHLPNAFDAGM